MDPLTTTLITLFKEFGLPLAILIVVVRQQYKYFTLQLDKKDASIDDKNEQILAMNDKYATLIEKSIKVQMEMTAILHTIENNNKP